MLLFFYVLSTPPFENVPTVDAGKALPAGRHLPLAVVEELDPVGVQAAAVGAAHQALLENETFLDKITTAKHSVLKKCHLAKKKNL